MVDFNAEPSVEFLAQLASLEKQVTEAKAEIALNEGLQRRQEAQLRSPERGADAPDEVGGCAVAISCYPHGNQRIFRI